MKFIRRIVTIVYLFTGYCVSGQLPPVFRNSQGSEVRSTELARRYLSPVRIVWMSDNSGKTIKNPESLLKPGNGQADLNRGNYTILKSAGDSLPGILLDFGREIHGGIQLVTTINNSKPAGRVRIRFGESTGEAMSDTKPNGATNDHATRDFVVTLPWLGNLEVGNSGFRFVRIDLAEPSAGIEIKEVSAVFIFKDIPYKGSFECDDNRLNEIWMTGAYTVHLNMQDYLWDGIKRDRLVWVGDLHPEVMTVMSVFGKDEVVPKSLDLARDLTPLPGWMNGISSYSMWWILIHRDWYYYQGDRPYLEQQKPYLTSLLRQLAARIDPSGREILDGGRFLDHPSGGNKEAIHAGLQALMVMSFRAGADLCKILNDDTTMKLCLSSLEKLEKHCPGMAGSKQAAALLALSGLVTPEKADRDVLARDGVHKMSTFYGYYMLEARARAEDYEGALSNIRQYWGGMLDLGATTFWEDFNIDWMENGARIDELVPEGKTDVHGTYGDYCYVSYRHSLCHGWASGPTSWMTRYLLGVNVVEPGCRRIVIKPHLCTLKWIKGRFPTPRGILEIEHIKENNKIRTTYKAPEGVEVILTN